MQTTVGATTGTGEETTTTGTMTGTDATGIGIAGTTATADTESLTPAPAVLPTSAEERGTAMTTGGTGTVAALLTEKDTLTQMLADMIEIPSDLLRACSTPLALLCRYCSCSCLSPFATLMLFLTLMPKSFPDTDASPPVCLKLMPSYPTVLLHAPP